MAPKGNSDTPNIDVAFPETKQGGTGPLVSIVLATYDPPETIRESLQSVVDQTYDNIELVVVDSSQLEPLRRLDEYSWITYVPEEPRGVAAAWNAGIAAASGDIVMFLADDDYYAPEKAERQVEAVRAGAEIVYSDINVINDSGRQTRLSSMTIDDTDQPYIKYFRKGHGIPHLSVAGRRSCFIEEPFLEELEAREDPHLWVRMLQRYEVERIPEPLATKRRRDDSLTSDSEMMHRNELQEISDLVDRFPSLDEYSEKRRQFAKYRHGKRLLLSGKHGRSRRVFFELLYSAPTVRVVALFLISLLPVGHRLAFEVVESFDQRLRQLRSDS